MTRTTVLLVALASVGCAGPPFTGREASASESTGGMLGSTALIVDDAEADAGPDSGNPDDAQAVDVVIVDASADISTDAATVDASELPDASTDAPACIPPTQTSYWYLVRSGTGCTVESTPSECLSAADYGCPCFETHPKLIATGCATGWTGCNVQDGGVVAEVTCQ